MKKLLLIIMVCLFAMPLFGGDISANFVVDYGKNNTFKDTLSTTHRKDSVYVTFPNYDRNKFYMSKTLPIGALIGASNKVFDITGDVELHLRCTTSAGASNSIVLWCKYLTWAPDSSRFEVLRHDSTFLDLDTPGTYIAAAADSLDFITGDLYHCTLTGHLKAMAGFVVYYSTDDSDAVFYPVFWKSFTRMSTPGQP